MKVHTQPVPRMMPCASAEQLYLDPDLSKIFIRRRNMLPWISLDLYIAFDVLGKYCM